MCMLMFCFVEGEKRFKTQKACPWSPEIMSSFFSQLQQYTRRFSQMSKTIFAIFSTRTLYFKLLNTVASDIFVLAWCTQHCLGGTESFQSPAPRITSRNRKREHLHHIFCYLFSSPRTCSHSILRFYIHVSLIRVFTTLLFPQICFSTVVPENQLFFRCLLWKLTF